MSDVFPKWTNRLPRNLFIGAVLSFAFIAAGFTYYFTPKYTRAGYQPIQPVAFSHNTHVSQTGLDCRYCHSTVEKSWFSNLPASSTCMNCHDQILRDDPRLALVRESAATKKPIPWVQIHKLPDYVYFNHSVHVRRGVSCLECHGQVNKLEETYHAQPFSMTFCLDCHRDPAQRLRPLNQVTELDWQMTLPVDPAGKSSATNSRALMQARREFGQKLVHDWNVEKLQSCSTCHR